MRSQDGVPLAPSSRKSTRPTIREPGQPLSELCRNFVLRLFFETFFCQNSIDKSLFALIRNVTLGLPESPGFEQRGAAFRSAQPRCSNEPAVSPHALAYLENPLGLASTARRLFYCGSRRALSAAPRHRPEPPQSLVLDNGGLVDLPHLVEDAIGQFAALVFDDKRPSG